MTCWISGQSGAECVCLRADALGATPEAVRQILALYDEIMDAARPGPFPQQSSARGIQALRGIY